MRKKNSTPHFTTFKESLCQLNETCEKRVVTLKEICLKLSGKGRSILLIFLCIPFGQVLGFAFFFGFLIAFLGFRMAFSHNSIWIPSFILRKEMKGKLLKKVIHQVLWFLKKIKPLSHPRYLQLSQGTLMQKVNGSLIGVVGICLAISMPIPFSSFFAALTFFFLGIGILNNDGILIALSYPLALVYIAFVIFTLEYISLVDIYHWVQQVL